MADLSPARPRNDASTLPAVSVVVPTRNEADNVRPLADRLREALGPALGEIVFVDDSDHETPRTIAAMQDQDPSRVRLVHRPAGSRPGGLGGAVAAGLETARSPWVVVMDGDLQHPPETVPELLAAVGADRAEAAVASRYLSPGRVTGLGGRFRRVVSRASGSAAKVFFPVRLRSVTDPMSGFFAVRRDAVRTAELRPVGYKILLEVLVRSRIQRVTEVAYTFQPRVAGESKASLREGL
ncbi:MAG TPA: glycosyltransferase, partial [Actinoplanes sp.]